MGLSQLMADAEAYYRQGICKPSCCIAINVSEKRCCAAGAAYLFHHKMPRPIDYDSTKVQKWLLKHYQLKNKELQDFEFGFDASDDKMQNPGTGPFRLGYDFGKRIFKELS